LFPSATSPCDFASGGLKPKGPSGASGASGVSAASGASNSGSSMRLHSNSFMKHPFSRVHISGVVAYSQLNTVPIMPPVEDPVDVVPAVEDPVVVPEDPVDVLPVEVPAAVGPVMYISRSKHSFSLGSQ